VFTTRRYTNTRLPLPLPLPKQCYIVQCACIWLPWLPGAANVCQMSWRT